MKFVQKVPNAEELREEFPLTQKQIEKRKEKISQLQAILAGKMEKKIICIGPCSADREDSVLEYMERLVKLQEKVEKRFMFIPRIYTSKPRTSGTGYKGLLHRPESIESTDDLYHGIIATRKMHLHIIQQTGMFGADEMLYPEAHIYISDLLSYTAVGARSVEDQQHRMVASGLDMPVGMKNPTSGDTEVMLNAIIAAQSKQTLLYHGWECHTEGNPYAHAILRGFVDLSGKSHSNYYYDNLCDLHDEYREKNLKNLSAIIDCNHSNSRKRYDEQIRIAKEVMNMCVQNKEIDFFVKGLMIESYLEDGCQMIGNGIYGKSITDPCLGWSKTEKLILDLYEM